MAQLLLPKPLVAGRTENVQDLEDNFQAIKTKTNGNIDTDNLATPNAHVWHTVFDSRRPFHLYNAMPSGTELPDFTFFVMRDYPLWHVATPSDYAVAGKTTQVRVVAYFVSNSVTPVATFTTRLCPTTAGGGAAGVLGVVYGTSLTGALCTPAAGTGQFVESPGVTLPASAASYTLGLVTSGTFGSGAMTTVTLAIEMRWV